MASSVLCSALTVALLIPPRTTPPCALDGVPPRTTPPCDGVQHAVAVSRTTTPASIVMAAKGFGKAPPPPPRKKPKSARATNADGARKQQKPKTKKDRFELQFTCNQCEARNTHSISRHAYSKGTVIVTCPSCNATHLIADNLNWIEDDFKNLEEYMERQGKPITKLVNDGVAESAAAETAAALDALDGGVDLNDDGASEAEGGAAPADPRRPWAGSMPGVEPLEGIDDDQARRIRDAVRKNKRRQRGADE